MTSLKAADVLQYIENDEEEWLSADWSEKEGPDLDLDMDESDTALFDERKSYNSSESESETAADPDAGPTTPVPEFKPEREPGLHLPDCHTRADLRKFLRPVGFFFKLFFTPCLVAQLCEFTNKYAHSVGAEKMSLNERWTDVDADEFYRMIGLLMHMSVVKVPSFVRYWSDETLLS
ncbi:PiggyBac transposable element-derived protein 4-like isoform x1 [Plakobranchus ocellatus]|uniref:PiggyBac transposable element-derived protein 4-like isoform x1 n=1 Tax=Plakobranchus ocellatus TaxID=259542 RepID=A0AAV3ZDD8_9GAST|nr:PiggyBac transposable element-derived protein 4-like isoform x1 [Plakobranchus ocellatus]